MTIDERLARQRQGGTAQASATPRRGSGDKPIATPRHTKQELQALRANLEANEAEGLADELVSAGLSEQDAAKAGVSQQVQDAMKEHMLGHAGSQDFLAMPRSQAHDKRLRKQPKKKPRTWLAVGGKLDDLKLGSKALNGLSSLATDAMKAARALKLKPMHAEDEEHSLDLNEDSGSKVPRRGVRAVGASNLTRRPRHLTPAAAPGGLRRKAIQPAPPPHSLPPAAHLHPHGSRRLAPACVRARRAWQRRSCAGGACCSSVPSWRRSTSTRTLRPTWT